MFIEDTQKSCFSDPVNARTLTDRSKGRKAEPQKTEVKKKGRSINYKE